MINTGFRLVYPFLPMISRGLNVAPQAVILGVTARSALGLGAPFLGSLGDRVGRRAAMLAGLAVFVLGGLLVGLRPTYATFLVALLAIGLSKILFDTALYAYVGDMVAFERRGTPMALIEFSWSGAYLLGVPAAGLLIGAVGWAAPFPVLSGLALLGGLWLWRTLPRNSGARPRAGSFVHDLSAVLNRRSALAGLGVGLLLATANEIVNIVYGLWMEDAFGLRIAALGAATAVIGLAELGGEGLVAGLTDRIGKRRSLAAGILLSCGTLLALPLLGTTLAGALVGLFALYLTFEYSIVSSLPLMTEQVPAARSTLMATNIAGLSLGRSLGALVGGRLFALGMQANTVAAAMLNLLALGLLLAFVKEQGE